MNPVRRLLNLLLCLVLALNGAALAHAGAASGHAHEATADAAVMATMPASAHADDAPPCHDAPEAAPEPAAPLVDAAEAPCCDEDAAVCDHACMAAAVSAALVSERAVPTGDRLRDDVPALALHARASPHATPPIRPPIG